MIKENHDIYEQNPLPVRSTPSEKKPGKLRQCFHLFTSLAGCLISLALFTSSASAFDVEVGEIHITQGIQHTDPIFWVPLVAERSTAVRVEVRRVNGTPGPVTGTLKVFVNGQEITPPGGVDDLNRNFPSPDNIFIPPAVPRNGIAFLLEFEDETLNFELPASIYPVVPDASQPVSNDIDFEVEIFSEGDTNPNNNIGRVEDLTVKRRGAPWLFKDRLFYFPNGVAQWPVPAANRPRENFIVPGVGDVMAPAIWPIPDAPTNTGTQTNPIFPPLLPGFFFRLDCDGDGKITFPAPTCTDPNTGRVIGDETGLLLYRLASRRQLLIRGGFGPDRLVYLFAWAQDGKLSGHDGLALAGANVGYGVDAENRGQQVFAHEFGHMVSLPHNMPGRVNDSYGWDVGARLHNNPLSMPDGVSGRVKPSSFYHDIMNSSGLETTQNTWIDLENYIALLDDPKLDVESANLFCEETRSGEYGTVVVYGVPVVGEAGTRMRVNTFTYPWCTNPNLKPKQANVELTLNVREPGFARTRTIKVPVSAQIVVETLNEKDHEIKLGPFATPIPLPKRTRVESLRVSGLNDEEGLIPTDMKASESVPQVRIVSPTPKSEIGQQTIIQWVADDPDKNSELSYQVAYSPNDGMDFVPIAVDLEEASVTIDATLLPRTKSGQGLIRVFVSDGINTSFSDVFGLSVGGELR